MPLFYTKIKNIKTDKMKANTIKSILFFLDFNDGIHPGAIHEWVCCGHGQLRHYARLFKPRTHGDPGPAPGREHGLCEMRRKRKEKECSTPSEMT